MNLEEVSNNSSIAQNVKDMFGVEVVYAGEELSMSKTKTDRTVTVKIKLVVKYDLTTYKGFEYANIKKVTGKIMGIEDNDVLESGVSIISNKYKIGQSGFAKSGAPKEYIVNVTGKKQVGVKWTYKPSGWVAVFPADHGMLGASQIVKLQRGGSGGSTWTVRVDNFYAI